MPRAPSKKREVKCSLCGKAFMTRHSQGKYCSKRCQRKGWRAHWRAYTARNREKRLAASRAIYQRNAEKVIARTKAYHQTPRGKLASQRARAHQLRVNSHKIAARSEVRKALLRGDLVRQPCERCGDPKSQAHHPDYSKPLEVKWLCQPHHREEDGHAKE